MTLTIRPLKTEDLDRVMEIYAYARHFMHTNGNPHQWVNRPLRETLAQDAENGTGFLMTDETGVIHAVFAFIIGVDPTYLQIEDGAWLNEEPYGTIHRIASDGTVHDILKKVLDFGKTKVSNIRIDTHEDNAPMRHLMDKFGFTRCGIIYVSDDSSDHSPRIAYQKAFDHS